MGIGQIWRVRRGSDVGNVCFDLGNVIVCEMLSEGRRSGEERRGGG
jgi:hypothetical protein